MTSEDQRSSLVPITFIELPAKKFDDRSSVRGEENLRLVKLIPRSSIRLINPHQRQCTSMRRTSQLSLDRMRSRENRLNVNLSINTPHRRKPKY